MALSRRNFIQGLSVFALAPLVSACSGSGDDTTENISNTPTTPTKPNENNNSGTTTNTGIQFVEPDEGDAHTATWMAFGATAGAWGTTGVYGNSRVPARKDLMRIASHLSRFETVNMLVNAEDKAQAEAFLAEVKLEANPTANKTLPAIGAGGKINLITHAVNDLWTRDTAPVFVIGADNKLSAVNFNFNGWGQENTGAAGWKKDPNKKANGIEDQDVRADMKVADFIIAETNAQKVSTWLVMEGGGIEVNGKGTAICTESCILNDNRNPNRSKADVEAELKRVVGVTKVIWLKGNKAKDITDGHIDFYARFVDETTVVYTLDTDNQSPDYQATLDNKAVLENATDAKGNKIKAIALVSPDFTKVQPTVESRNKNTSGFKFNTNGFAAGYVGFYLANNCVIMAGFGDVDTDKKAYDQLVSLFPTRTIIQITTDGLANGGGTIHCATQQQIAV